MATPLGIREELTALGQLRYDLTFLEFNSKFKFHSEKFASLVHLVREARAACVKLETDKTALERRLDDTERQHNADQAYLESALRALREENEALRAKLSATQDHVEVLQIERERYLALLNEK